MSIAVDRPPAVIRHCLSDTARSGAYDRAAIQRLMTDEYELRRVWDWLSIQQDAAVLCERYICAALESYEHAKLSCESDAEPSQSSVRPRANGRQYRFLRAFVRRLKQMAFPLHSPGAQVHIATIARVLLNDFKSRTANASALVPVVIRG